MPRDVTLADLLAQAARDVPKISEAEWQEAKARTDAAAPRVLPAGWREERIPPGSIMDGGRCYVHVAGLSVLMSAGLWEDGKWWLHVTLTGRKRCPYHAELTDAKDLFIGRERQAIHLYPPRSRHISLHPYCLHLWSCLDEAGDGLPDFGRHGTI